jgi:hypothetical protein
MKKGLTILFFFYAFLSNAQNTLNNVGLTSIAPASVAYSVRQLSTSYTGPLLRIKINTSFYDVYPDETTKKFTITSKISAPISTYNAAIGVASTNAISTLITASTNATVAIWYDQSGNNVHVLSSNGSAQIITAGSINMMNGQPTIRFFGSGSSSNLISVNTVNYNSQTLATVNAVAQNIATTDLVSGIISTGDSGGWGLNYDPSYSIKGYWIDGSGQFGASVNETSTDAKIITGLMGTSTSSSIYSNSVLKGTKATHLIANGVADKINVGIRGENATQRQFNGNISETMLFPKNLTSAEQAALEASQSIYLLPSVTITSSATGAVCSGTSVTFTASTSGMTNPSYQWYKNSVAINGATTATYTTTALSNNDAIYVSCSGASNIVSDNSLALWLDASNTSSYSSGSIWYDLSGNGRNATINSSQTFLTQNGGVFQFNGTANPMLINKVTTATSEISMSAWVFITPGTTQGAFIKNGASLGNTFGAGGGGGFCAGTFPGMLLAGQSWLGSNSPTANFSSGWQLCTMVISGSSPTTYKYYINGTLANTATFSSPMAPNGSYTALGDNYGDAGGCTPFNSKMGAAYFYTKALSVSEILQNYNASAARFGLTNINGTASNTITTTVNAGPSGTLTILGDGCINKTTLNTTSGQTSYTWYRDGGAISGATSNNYTPTIPGEYKVQVANGACVSMSTTTIISTCGVTADGRMSIFETSTTIVSKEGAKNNGNGISETGKVLSPPTPPVITNGLQLHYDTNNPGSYSGSGPTLTDLSGNGRHGTLENSPSFTTLAPTAGGGVLSFNGTNQYISTSYTPANTCTISIWFYNNLNYSDFNRGIFSTYHNPNSTNGIYMGTRSPSLNLSRDANVGYATTVVPSLSINTWYNVTVTSDAAGSSGTGTIKVYLNGNLETTLTGAKTTHATVLNIGRTRYDANYWSGYLGSAMVYNTALSDTEVLTNYNAQKTRFGY